MTEMNAEAHSDRAASRTLGSKTRGESRPPEGKPGPVGRAMRANEDREGVASGRGRAALLALILILVGCGGGAKKPVSAPAKPKEEPTKSVATGPVEIVQKEVVGEEKAPGAVAWQVAGKRSQITFAEGKATGMLYDVEGTLHGEKTETKFTAKQGKVDQKSDSLELTGDITATASDGGVLRADKLIWLKERGLVRALGHVRYSGGGYQAGEFEELLATSDLKKMGTPDMFPSTMELKKKK